jgi:hypothetical protein
MNTKLAAGTLSMWRGNTRVGTRHTGWHAAHGAHTHTGSTTRGQRLTNCLVGGTVAGIMARPIRVEFANAVYHVTARGNERKAIVRDDPDRERFLETLEETVGRFGVVLMRTA